MNRAEAVSFLFEVRSLCKHMSPNGISFEDSSPEDVSNGLKVHIKGRIYYSDKQMVHRTAKRHNLVVLENDDDLVVYEPKVVLMR